MEFDIENWQNRLKTNTKSVRSSNRIVILFIAQQNERKPQKHFKALFWGNSNII